MTAFIEKNAREGVELRTATEVLSFFGISAALLLTGYGMWSGNLAPAFILAVVLVSIPEPKA